MKSKSLLIVALLLSLSVFGASASVSAAAYGGFVVDGDLAEWQPRHRLDRRPFDPVPGIASYGAFAADNYVLGISSAAIAPGAAVTIWLNTDRNAATGHQIFLNSQLNGGAEYNVHLLLGSSAGIYSGAAGQVLVPGTVDYGFKNGSLEVAIPRSLVGNTPGGTSLLIAINNQFFAPADFFGRQYLISDAPCPDQTTGERRIAIVYSDSSAANYFDRKAYSQLFMSAQHQAMQSGIPYDLLSEGDLINPARALTYHALVFPYFASVPSALLPAIEDRLYDVSYRCGTGLITSGNFLTNSETGEALPGNSYARMNGILGVMPLMSMGPVASEIRATAAVHPVLDGYSAGEEITRYPAFWTTVFAPVEQAGSTILAESRVGNSVYNALLAIERGGRNVHFGNDLLLGDTNLGLAAIRWAVYGNETPVGLQLSRQKAIFLTRVDMDQSMFVEEVPLVDVPLFSLLSLWKQRYGFVGSFYINVGNNPGAGETTNWAVSRPLYLNYQRLGNEIGSHSYTHPDDTNPLSTERLVFEFRDSKNAIDAGLGISIKGAAIPGNPESLGVAGIAARYYDYVSGGYSAKGAGFPGAFGFPTPDFPAMYFSPDMTFDFTIIEYLKLNALHAEQLWQREYNQLTAHGAKPIVLWPWHDYGPIDFENKGYTRAMFENTIMRVARDNAEFTTLEDAFMRIHCQMGARLFVTGTAPLRVRVDTCDSSKSALLLPKGEGIERVENWYAYDQRNVFLPQQGGTFVIHRGPAPAAVTRITELPMRAALKNVTGDGRNLQFSFDGEGTVTVELALRPGDSVKTEGADRVVRQGATIQMIYSSLGLHAGKVMLLNGCGDGHVAAGETCDDGNGTAGDGCSAACRIETGYACQGQPSQCVRVTPGDRCPFDPAKTAPGQCGCGVPDVDLNRNGIVDCLVRKDMEKQTDTLESEIAGYKLLSSKASTADKAKNEARKKKIIALMDEVYETILTKRDQLNLSNPSKALSLIITLRTRVNLMFKMRTSALFAAAKKNAQKTADDLEDLFD